MHVAYKPSGVVGRPASNLQLRRLHTVIYHMQNSTGRERMGITYHVPMPQLVPVLKMLP